MAEVYGIPEQCIPAPRKVAPTSVRGRAKDRRERGDEGVTRSSQDLVLELRPWIVSPSRVSQTLNSVSCAIQTEILDNVSCAIQTEVPDSVIDEEISRDKDESSLDTKEDIILRDRLKNLLTKGSDYDVTICVQEKEFEAHRNILSARSAVFAMMLAHDTKENSTGTISIEDCDPESFGEFLLYVYSGRMSNLSPSNALHLYYTADKYDPCYQFPCAEGAVREPPENIAVCKVYMQHRPPGSKAPGKRVTGGGHGVFCSKHGRNPHYSQLANIYDAKPSGGK